jgi:peptidylprolyl isomerase
MGTDKRERQKAGRAARVAAAEAAQKRADSRRRIWWVVGTLVFVVAVLLVVTIIRGDDDSNETASVSTTQTSIPTPSTLASVEGQPCVAQTDPQPPGAPEVPIVPGPPPTEFQTTDLVEGTGEVVPANATITVDYIAVMCSNGKILDASYLRGEPSDIPLAQTIPAWQQGIPGMKVGGQRLLVVPPDLGYGDTGDGSEVAPGETIFFVVDVKGIASATTPNPG